MTQDRPRRLAAVWFADIVGYPELSARDEDLALAVVRELQRIARRHAQARSGRVVKLMGDAVLAAFDSVDGALRAALALRDGFLASGEAEAGAVSIRVGLHLGEVADGVDGDVYGDAVNVASRIEGAAEPGQVVLSQAAFLTVQQRTSIEAEDLGEFELKGLADPIRLYSARLVGGAEVTSIRELLQEAIAPLQLLDVEGMGGMGEIYLARDPGLRRTLAVKILRSELAADPRARTRFQREATVIAGLSHPNVVTVHSVGELKDETPYFVMDYVEGGSLEDRIREEGPMSVPEARRIIGEVASALSAAHGKGIVHRDIKAANVLWDQESGRALVTDWGIAALDPTAELSPETRLTKTGVIIGSPEYMSPEQLAGDEVGPETDIYSLGLLAFELLTGNGPFPSETPRALMIAHLREDPPRLSSLRREVEPELESVIAQCLAKDPGARPKAEEVASRFAPGGGAMLEWPPPGLEVIKGQGPQYFAQVAMAASTLAIPILLAFAARMEWEGQSLIRDLIQGRLGILVVLFLILIVPAVFFVTMVSASRGEGVLVLGPKEQNGSKESKGFIESDPTKTALKLGYGWRVVLETLLDRWGDYGNLIAGRREFAVLDLAKRAKLRRRRLRLVGYRWAAALLLPFTLIGAIHLASRGMDPGLALLLGIALPLTLGALSFIPPDPHAVRLARATMVRRRASREMLDSQTDAWKEALGKVTGTAGPDPGRPTSARTWYAYQAFSVVILLIPFAYFLSALIAVTMGSVRLSLPELGDVAQRFERVRSASHLRLPADSSLSAADAGQLLSEIVDWEPDIEPWIGDRPTEETIPGSELVGGSLSRPFTLSIGKVIPGALQRLSPEEDAYLRGFTGDPRFSRFEALARAPAYDPGLPPGYTESMIYGEASRREELLPLQDVAYHKLAEAGSLISRGDLEEGEQALREIVSVGLPLAEESNDLDQALLGRNLAIVALDGLGQLYLASDRAEEALALSGPREPIPSAPADPVPGRSQESGARVQDWIRSSLTLAVDGSVPRSLRFDAIARVERASECTSLEGIFLGPPPEVEETVSEARGSLIRYPSDQAYLAMATETTPRAYRRLTESGGDRLKETLEEGDAFSFWILRTSAILFRNPRFATCPWVLVTP